MEAVCGNLSWLGLEWSQWKYQEVAETKSTKYASKLRSWLKRLSFHGEVDRTWKVPLKIDSFAGLLPSTSDTMPYSPGLD